MTLSQTVVIPRGSRGLDFAGWRPTTDTLRSLGISVVLRYVGLGGSWKLANRTEVQKYLNAGIAVMLIVEQGEDSWHGGYDKGVAHGKVAAATAQAYGYPKGLAIPPAWDTNVGPGDTRALGYGNGFADVVEAAGYALGVYGDLDVIRMLQHRSQFNWLAGATSWSDPSKPYQPETQPDYELVHMRQTIIGSEPNYDMNNVLRPFKAWLPHEVPDSKPIERPPIVDTPTAKIEEDMPLYFTHSEKDNQDHTRWTFWALVDGRKRHVTGVELDEIARADRETIPALTWDKINAIPDHVPFNGGSGGGSLLPFRIAMTGTAEA